jgi:hypothetical protein
LLRSPGPFRATQRAQMANGATMFGLGSNAVCSNDVPEFPPITQDESCGEEFLTE